jgi:hypothetical protein
MRRQLSCPIYQHDTIGKKPPTIIMYRGARGAASSFSFRRVKKVIEMLLASNKNEEVEKLQRKRGSKSGMVHGGFKKNCGLSRCGTTERWMLMRVLRSYGFSPRMNACTAAQ